MKLSPSLRSALTFCFLSPLIKRTAVLPNCRSRVLHKSFFAGGTEHKACMSAGRTISTSRYAMSDELQKALAAEEAKGEDSIFAKIVRGEIPSDKVYEDDKCLAFRDASPQAPKHILLVPKKLDGLTRLSNATEKHKDILGHMMWAAGEVSRKEKLGDFRLVINNGPTACQSIYYLHMHILAGRTLKWPPG